MYLMGTLLFSRTQDEDFGMLLEAAVMYDRRVAAILGEDDSTEEKVIWEGLFDGRQYLYPRLLFIITGNDYVALCAISACMFLKFPL